MRTFSLVAEESLWSFPSFAMLGMLVLAVIVFFLQWYCYVFENVKYTVVKTSTLLFYYFKCCTMTVTTNN